MTAYLARRVISGTAVLAGLIVLTFFASHYIGDPVHFLVDKELTSEAERQLLIETGGFDRPAWRQFLDFASGAVRGDFGRSIWQNRPAATVVLERVPATALLAAAALAFTIIVAVPAAVFAGRNADRWPETVVTTVATACSSMASFWWGLVLILVLAVRFSWLPTSGYGSWQHIILPVLALTPPVIGRITQVLQTSVANELRQPYVSTARSKGLRERAVVSRHVLRNTAIVAVTLFGAELAALLNGTVLVESIFAWPGVGQVALQAVQRRDLPVLMAAVFYVGVLVTVINLAVDVAYAWLDPRICLR
jgi:peptide/nickel transport system permease protein